MLESAMVELLLANPDHFVSRPRRPLPKTCKLGPAIGIKFVFEPEPVVVRAAGAGPRRKRAGASTNRGIEAPARVSSFGVSFAVAVLGVCASANAARTIVINKTEQNACRLR
jgi:hypothetical protein